MILLIGPYLGMAQSSVKINYNSVYVGKNISIDCDYQRDKILLSIGANYYPGVNKDNVSFNTFYKNRGTPSNIRQHFGLQFKIGYSICANKHFNLYGVYKGSLAYMNTYFKFFQNYAALVPEPQGIEDYAVLVKTREFGPIFSFDNNLGLLFKGKITDDLFLNLYSGIGFTYLKSNDKFVITSISYKGASFLSTSFTIGFGYSLNNSRRKNI